MRFGNVSTGGITGIADRLVKAGWIDRYRCEEDRRVVYLMITDSGRELLEVLRIHRIDVTKEFASGLTQAEIKELVHINRKIIETK